MTFTEFLKHFPILIFFIALIPVIILDLWAIIDISSASSKNRDQKWLWTNVVILFPLFGVFVYLFYGRKRLKN